MTQPVAPAPSFALSQPGGTMPMANGNAGPSADFSAILAVQADEPTLAGSEEALLSAAPVVTAEAASTGNILPPILPLSPVVLEEPVEPEASTPVAAASQMVRLGPVGGKYGKAAETDATAKSAAVGLAFEGLIEAAAPTGDTMLTAATPPTDLTAALAQPSAEAAPSTPITTPAAIGKPVQGSTTDPKTDHEKFGQGAVHRTIPTLPLSASSTAQAQMLRHATATPPTPPEPELPAVQPAVTGVAALVPAEEVRVELALPRLAQAGALTRDEPRANTRLPDLVLTDAAGPLGAGPVPTPVLGAVPAAPIPQVRPHDFASLIERIAVARDAAASQAVSITVAHQDFGPVRLNFRPEESGLSIAMSSADPGFARAAAAAPAPVLPVTSPEQPQLNQHQRSENGAAQTGGQSQSQSRGGSPDQRRDGQPQPNPAPRRNHSNPAPRTGVFA